MGGDTPPLGTPLTMEQAAARNPNPNPHPSPNPNPHPKQAAERIFGFVLCNDWSARDIQKFEYVPLGPFGAKNFATTISPWVVTVDALAPFACPTSAGVQTNPTPLPYLQDPSYSSYDVALSVAIAPGAAAAPTVVTESNYKHMYWSCKQQLVHHAVTGCDMRPGDLLASGTISGDAPHKLGSMLELSWQVSLQPHCHPTRWSLQPHAVEPPPLRHVPCLTPLLSWQGTREVGPLSDGTPRKFLKDGDVVTLRGACTGPHFTVGFGECTGQVLPAGATPPPRVPPPPACALREVSLQTYWRSSCSWRVRVALAFYGVPYATVPVDLLQGEQAGVGPMAQVPRLSWTDAAGARHSLTQSLALLAFLSDACDAKGAPSLRPADAVARARAAEIAEIIASGTQPLQNLAP